MFVLENMTNVFTDLRVDVSDLRADMSALNGVLRNADSEKAAEENMKQQNIM